MILSKAKGDAPSKKVLDEFPVGRPGRFIYRQNLITKRWRWRFKAPNGTILVSSNKSFACKRNCLTNIHSLIWYSTDCTVDQAS